MRIACIHQGYEQYGSDRSFAESVRTIRGAFPSAEIEVVLPRPGPITDLLAGTEVRLTFEPLWLLQRRNLLRLATVGAATLPIALARAAARFRRADLVYINTSVVLDHILAARIWPQRAILHLHEIGEGPVMDILRTLVRFSGAEVIFNSKATAAAFDLPASRRTHVVYNGVPGPSAACPVTYDGRRPLRLLMLGRVNRIKGQEVLIEAVARLPDDLRSRIEVRLVGSAFENPKAEAELVERIHAAGLAGRVEALPFAADPSAHYLWADIVAMPSQRPESLGRVAIEAMAYGRPPIASAIGGLTEVVEPERTGWLVPPGDSAALSERLASVIADPSPLPQLAAAGRTRYETLFAEAVADRALADILRQKLARAAG